MFKEQAIAYRKEKVKEKHIKVTFVYMLWVVSAKSVCGLLCYRH